MIGTLKGTALYGALGAAVGALTETAAYAALQGAVVAPPGGDLIGGAATGGAVSAAVFWIYKARVDRLESTKADRSELQPIHDALKDIKDDVKYLVRGLQKDRGE